jgi:hypothetical protein
MQSAKRKTDLIEVPPCIDKAKTYLIEAMVSVIDGYIAFMGEDADAVVSGHFADATAQFKSATQEMDRVSSCAPNC